MMRSPLNIFARWFPRKPPCGCHGARSPGDVLSRAKERVHECTCRKPLGTGWDPRVREAMVNLARAATAERRKLVRAQARALADADIVAAIAATANPTYAIRVVADGQIVDVFFYATEANAAARRHDRGHVSIMCDEGDLAWSSSWLVAPDVPEALRRTLFARAPTWVTIQTGEGPPKKGRGPVPRVWRTLVENAMLDRLREQGA